MSRQFLASLAVTALVASHAAAQATSTPPQTARPATTGAQATQPGQQAQTGQAGQLDHGIATCLYLANQEEIAMAQFAEGRIQNEELKKFVQMLLKDHQAALQKLQSVSPQLASANLQLQGAAGGQAGATQTGASGSQPRATGTQPGATGAQSGTPGQPGQPAAQQGGDMHAQMTALQRRTAEECLALTTKELSEHEGAEFEHAFVGQQMGAHIATLAKLRASREFASGQLQQVIDESTQMVEHHLEEAKQLAKTMKEQHHSDNASGEQARRDGSAARRQ